ncbi:MAG: myxococcus cysteine-rich repeat containing protein [Candidatus Falkowbacteria bacterium]
MTLRRVTGKIYVLVFFILCAIAVGYFSSQFTLADSASDAIAIRILPNPKHFSVLRWYQSKGFTGSPAVMSVDGYDAVRDGRTVYVGFSNIVEVGAADSRLTVGDKLYTNIMVISYNQDQTKETVEIFNRILENFKINSNITAAGSCSETLAQKCVYGTSCQVPQCSACSNTEHCISSHDVAVRDTRRLADLADLGDALQKYRDNNQGFCPKLAGGSYLPNKSVSTWPSWQEKLGIALGGSLPVDPINRLGPCGSNFNPITCWDEKQKAYGGKLVPVFGLPTSSNAYYYSSTPDGHACSFSVATEANLKCAATGECIVGASVAASYDFDPVASKPPVVLCGSMVGGPYGEFTHYIGAYDPDPEDNNSLTWSIDTSGVDWVGKGWSAAPILQKVPVINQRSVYALNAGAAGSYPFTITVTDHSGTSTVKTCTINLFSSPPAIDPASIAGLVDQHVYAGEQMEPFSVVASEPKHDYPMTFSFTGYGLDGTIIGNMFSCSSVSPNKGETNGNFNCYLNKQAVNHPGNNYQVVIRAMDKSGEFFDANYDLEVINYPPVFTDYTVEIEASTTRAVDEVHWNARDLLSNFPLTHGLDTPLPAGLTYSTTNVPRPNTVVTYRRGAAITNSSVGVNSWDYHLKGQLTAGTTFDIPTTTLQYTATVTDKFGAAIIGNITLAVTNAAPVITGAALCPAKVRHSNPYLCTLPVYDANGNAIVDLASSNLPSGIIGQLVGTNIKISGTPAISAVGPAKNVVLVVKDEFNYYSDPASFSLQVVDYCGDNVKQNPNLEGVVEQCDGTDGIANSPSLSGVNTQYACAANCQPTGGYCGDGTIQAGKGEVCDDGNQNWGDGCGRDCLVEQHYTCVGALSVCSPDTQVVNCTAKIADSSWNTVSSITQTWNGSGWSPTNVTVHNATPSGLTCRFICNFGFTWNGTICKPNTVQDISCTGNPLGSYWNGVPTFTQTWNGAAWAPASYPASYNTTPGICTYQCSQHYTWDGTSQCIADTQSATCTGLPVAASWNISGTAVESVLQTWNGSDWSPPNSGSYGSTMTPCTFQCNIHLSFDALNSLCKPDTKQANCVGLPAHAAWTTGGKFTQTWDDVSGQFLPLTKPVIEGDVGECAMKCNAHYTWDGSQCQPETIVNSCGNLPPESTWVNGSTYTATWDGTGFTPLYDGHPRRGSTGICKFKCKPGFDELGQDGDKWCMFKMPLAAAPATDHFTINFSYNFNPGGPSACRYGPFETPGKIIVEGLYTSGVSSYIPPAYTSVDYFYPQYTPGITVNNTTFSSNGYSGAVFRLDGTKLFSNLSWHPYIPGQTYNFNIEELNWQGGYTGCAFSGLVSVTMPPLNWIAGPCAGIQIAETDLIVKTDDFSADSACEDIGGNLPSENQLACILNNSGLGGTPNFYGVNHPFKNNDYYWATDNGSVNAIKYDAGSLVKVRQFTQFYNTRCVK